MTGHRQEREAIGAGRFSPRDRTWPSVGTVVATPAAVDAILRLRARRHMIAFRPNADSHDRDGPSFLTEAELPARINELQLGEIGGVPFLVDADQYKRWGRPDLVVDVPEGDDEPARAGRDSGCGLALRASRRTGRSQKRD